MYKRQGWTTEGLFIYKKKGGGSWTVVVENPAGASLPAGAVLRVEAVGSAWKVKINGTEVYAFTDADHQAATKHGLYSASGNVTAPRWDDFKVYSL